VVPTEGMPIQEVCTLLDLPAPTIRSWERRYGIPIPDRSLGGHRRFSHADVTQLQLMRDEVARGRRPVDAAAWVAAEVARPLPHQELIDELVAAALRLDRHELLGTLDSSVAEHGVAATTCDVVLPALRRIGVAWQAGRCDTAHEHLASDATLFWMHRVTATASQPAGGGVILLACGPDDHHSLGLEAFALLLRERGHDVRVLGPRVPTSSLVTAINGTRASATVVVSHLAMARRAAVGSLVAAGRSCPSVFYAGNAFTSRRSRQRVPGTYLGEDFREATDLVASELSDPDPTGA
jgi:DNA-binding transcriptional MerR regulator